MLKFNWTKGSTRSAKIEGVRQGCYLAEILLNFYYEYFTNEALEKFGLKIAGKAIRTVKYADDAVLLAKEQTVLQSMIDRVIETERCCGMEMNVEKN